MLSTILSDDVRRDIYLIICIPLPSNQHFVWPINVCILADMCNHTWIPECGRDPQYDHYRLFIDECDLIEYNCDYEKNYEIMNYSDCFTGGIPMTCPPVIPCPSHPTCPNHKFHRMGDHYIYVTTARKALKVERRQLKKTLPLHMLKGKRRYTPIPKIRRLRAAKLTKEMVTFEKKALLRYNQVRKGTKAIGTVVIKREIVFKNGKRMVRLVKGSGTRSTKKEDSDFLE